MKIKKIFLNNIRSYESQEITFPEGSILLSGDIGSGKTSILLGIEFALFGFQPGQKSSSLLRNGKNSGGVTLNFEIGGKEITIERSLKKGKTITQDACYLTIDGSRTQLSVMELKSFILDLLNYPREFSKKQNMLYKFTVYTPQEEMKQIVQENAESRINTLRHVFGIDKYKTILENASLLTSRIREEKRIKEGVITGINKEMTDLSDKEKELQSKQSEFSFIEKDFSVKKQETGRAREEMESALLKVEEMRKTRQEIEGKKMSAMNKKEIISNNERFIKNLKLEAMEIEKMKFSESDFSMLDKEIESRKKEKDDVNEDLIKTSSEISLLNAKNSENDTLKDKISHMNTCPTCLQNLDDSYKKNIIQKCLHEIGENGKKLDNLILRRNSLLEKSKNLNNEIFLLEKKLRDISITKLRVEEIKGKLDYVVEIEKSNKTLGEEIESLNRSADILSETLAFLEKHEKNYEEIKSDFDTAMSRERVAEIRLVESKREMDFLARQIVEIKSRLAEAQKTRNQINYLMEVENWISGDFIDLVSLIEKNIMMKLKHEFSKVFSKWFSMLVSESFNVYVQDDFTPVIEQQDYELDYSYLSGGERTAIALAYRLALNQTINSLLSNIETKDMVILDEPTDGFSSQQLDKMRDVLNELNVSQLIIVSHEPKIEAFVDNVIRFRKENGVSMVDK